MTINYGTALTTVTLPDGTVIYFDSQGRWIGTKKAAEDSATRRMKC